MKEKTSNCSSPTFPTSNIKKDCDKIEEPTDLSTEIEKLDIADKNKSDINNIENDKNKENNKIEDNIDSKQDKEKISCCEESNCCNNERK